MVREMKDSGVAWIGEIPGGWKLVRIKDISPVNRGASPRPIDDPIYFDDDGEYAWVRISDVSASLDGFLESTTQRLSKLGEVKSVKRQPGDLFLSIAGTIGKACITKIKACIHDGFVYFPRMNESATKKFFFYLFNSGLAYDGLGKFGTQLNLNTETVGNILVPLPPLDEQRAIADYLDQQTALIDQRLNTLEEKKTVLAELRKATIHEAVTKGLNKNAPMKDSGNLFIGKIPAHWEVRCIKELATKIGSGKTPLGGSSVYVEEGVMFLRSQNVWNEGLFVDDVAYIAEAVDQEMRSSRVKVGDILINVTGASIGRACLVPDGMIANVNQHVCIVRLRNKRLASFVARALQSCATQNQIAEVQVGAAREGLNFEQIGNLFVVFPPPAEQLAIANHLDQQTQLIDAQLATLDEQTQVLKELRKAIIHEAVTGNI